MTDFKDNYINCLDNFACFIVIVSKQRYPKSVVYEFIVNNKNITIIRFTIVLLSLFFLFLFF